MAESKFKWPSPAALLAYCMMVHALFYGMPWQLDPPRQSAGRPKPPPPPAASHWDAMASLVEPHGYELQQHFVTTPDGFILRIFRISRPRTHIFSPCNRTSTLAACSMHTHQHSLDSCSPSTPSNQTSTCTSTSDCRTQRPVVFLQHALMDSSAGWLILGPGRSLALQLVDAGFDVFLGNTRGNRYSRNHTTLDSTQPAFWAWSWQQQAEYDLPASLSYVLEATQQQRLVYIGYSQGTMTALAALSTQPQLAASISLAILLAPVAFTTGMTSPSFVLSSRLQLDAYGLRHGWMEWGSHQPYWANVCGHVSQLCLYFLTSFCGLNPHGNVDPALVPTVFQHLPAGTSVQVMAHWAQGIRRRDTKYLTAFDYGTDCSSGGSNSGSSGDASMQDNSSLVPSSELPLDRGQTSHCSHCRKSPAASSAPSCNQQAYGEDTPPVYNMSAITTPLALFSGGQDTISTLTDVKLLKQQLQPGVVQEHKHFLNYGHLDFELGTDAPDVLYPTILQLARRFSGMA